MPLLALDALPVDWRNARLLGRIRSARGPVPILIEHGTVHDLSPIAPTVAHWLEEGPFELADAKVMGDVETTSLDVLSPIDLQCVKGTGVTFIASMLERVVEERARGDAQAVASLRTLLEQQIGGALTSVVPGSDGAAEVKAALLREGLWSQYLEVAIGPDAELFTKAAVLSTVGCGADVGIRSDSHWNNPEPEMVLVVDSRGEIRGATLGNDVNLRDFEGRSALLLGKAKDNRGACALGPFIRLFDADFTLDDVRSAGIEFTIDGEDGFHLSSKGSMSEISRDPAHLVRQAVNQHDYPDGFVLFCGTLFAPTKDRGTPGMGFTHHVGDRVDIASARLGRLSNTVKRCDMVEPWRYGLRSAFEDLLNARREK